MKTACALLVVALITIQAASQIPRSRQAPTQPAASTETYESVDIDADGNLRILTSEHRTVIVPKGGSPKAGESVGKQTAFGKRSPTTGAPSGRKRCSETAARRTTFPCNSSSTRVARHIDSKAAWRSSIGISLTEDDASYSASRRCTSPARFIGN